MKRGFIIYIIISLTIIFPGKILGQNPMLNAWKYWYYRWRLINDFMLIGDCHGCSIPASVRLRKPYQAPDSLALNWGDSAVRLGWYISALAGEYRILYDNGESTDSVARELYYALIALERLDAYSDQIENGDPVLPSSYTVNDLDGYFVRDDVPKGFVESHYSHFNSGWTNTAANVEMTWSSYRDRVEDATKYPCGSKKPHLGGIGESIDQAAGVLHGLAAIKFLMPPSASYNGRNFHNWTNETVDRIVGHIRDHNAHPYSNCKNGYIYSALEAQMLYFSFSEAGCKIKASGQPLTVSHQASYWGFGKVFPVNIKHPPYNEFYFIPFTPLSVFIGLTFGFPKNSCSDYNAGFYNTFSNWALNGVILNGIFGKSWHKVCNRKNALTNPSLIVTILTLGTRPLCTWCGWNIGISSTLAPIAQPYYGIKIPIYPFLFIPWPIPNFLRMFWFSVKNRNVTEHVMEGLAWGTDHNLAPLISQVYYKNQYRKHLWGLNILQDLIDRAPCKGSYHFSSFFASSVGVTDSIPDNEWMGICRFNRPEMRHTTYTGKNIPAGKCNSLFKGEFCGIDYMNLYNYLYIYRKGGNNFAFYENMIDRVLVSTKHDLPITSANNWGSFQKAAWIAAFRSIEASNLVSKKANTEYVAGEYIHMKPGFHAQYGCYFHAYLDTLRGCDWSKKPKNYVGPFFPFVNQSSYGKYAAPNYIPHSPRISENSHKETNFEIMHSQSGYLHVYPNPANKILHIKSYGPEATELIIRDVFGRILFKENGFFETKNIDISTWKQGVYIVEIKTLQGSEHVRFIKLKQ